MGIRSDWSEGIIGELPSMTSIKRMTEIKHLNRRISVWNDDVLNGPCVFNDYGIVLETALL